MFDVLHKTCILSGGFDPLHVGHVRMINHAKELCDDVIVGVNSDDWLMRKKGYIFMPFEERLEIIQNLKGVDKACGFNDDDDTAKDLILNHLPSSVYAAVYFGNGGDRVHGNVPEEELCQELGIKMLWGLGGGKVQSSSKLYKGH